MRGISVGRLGLSAAAAMVAALGVGTIGNEIPAARLDVMSSKKVRHRSSPSSFARSRGRSYPDGLNGKRAVARRLRQMQAIRVKDLMARKLVGWS